MKKNLKLLFMTFFLIFLTSSIQANNKQMNQLENEVNKYFDSLKNEDVKTMVSYIYEPTFKLVEKKTLIESYEKAIINKKAPKLIKKLFDF